MAEPPLIHLFQEELEKVISKYGDAGLTFGEIIGVIEVVKYNTMDTQYCEEE